MSHRQNDLRPQGHGINTHSSGPEPRELGRSTTTTESRRFACPFFKRYGIRGIKGESCTGKGWLSSHRVKEHIYRKHGPPISCPRCHLEFKQQEDVNVHLNSEKICESKHAPVNARIQVCTEAQRAELKRKRKRKSEGNEMDNWNRIYKILFPDQTIIPPPYADENGPESRQQLEFQQHVRAKLSTELRTILVDKVPKDTKYATIHSQMKTLIESAFDTGLVDEAVNRVTHSFKRRLNSPAHDSPSNNKQARFTSASPISTHEREKASHSDDTPRNPLNTDSRQYSHALEFTTGFQLNSPRAFQAEPWGSGQSVSFSGEVNLPIELNSPIQLGKEVGTHSSEQPVDNWLFLDADPDSAQLLSQSERYVMDSDPEVSSHRTI